MAVTQVSKKMNAKEIELFAACKAGKLELVKTLLEDGVSIDARDENGNTCLHEAARSGNIKLYRFLVKKARRLGYSRNNDNCIPEAILWVKSANENQLITAVCKGDLERVKELVAQGADRNVHTELGTNLVIMAASSNHTEVLIFLLDSGVEINAVDESKQSALHRAVYFASLECIRILLERKCNVNLQDVNGFTPLMLAAEDTEETDEVFDEKASKVFEMLIEFGACDYTLVDAWKRNVLHVAVDYGNVVTVKKLLRVAPTLIDAVDDRGDQPIHLAVYRGSNDIIDSLLTAKPQCLNAKGHRQRTPLQHAIAMCFTSTIEFLLLKGADCSIADCYGFPPFEYALCIYLTCCANQEGVCKMKSKLDTCPQIASIYESLKQSFEKQCVYLAIALFIGTTGNAHNSTAIKALLGEDNCEQRLLLNELARRAQFTKVSECYDMHLYRRLFDLNQKEIAEMRSDHFEIKGRLNELEKLPKITCDENGVSHSRGVDDSVGDESKREM